MMKHGIRLEVYQVLVDAQEFRKSGGNEFYPWEAPDFGRRCLWWLGHNK